MEVFRPGYLPICQPYEYLVITGGIGFTVLISQPVPVLKALPRAFVEAVKGTGVSKPMFNDLLGLMAIIFDTMRRPSAGKPNTQPVDIGFQVFTQRHRPDVDDLDLRRHRPWRRVVGRPASRLVFNQRPVYPTLEALATGWTL